MVAWSCPAHLKWLGVPRILGMGDTMGCHRALGLGDSFVLVVHAYFYPMRKAVRVFVPVLSALAPRGKTGLCPKLQEM